MIPDWLVAAAFGFLGGRGGSFIDAYLKPLATYEGERLLDKYKKWRGQNLGVVGGQTQDMVDAAGFTPVAVPGRILFPILDYASFEEDDELRTKWAALLANAGAPGPENRILPGYAEILRQLTPGQAKILDWFYDTFGARISSGIPLIGSKFKEINQQDLVLFLSDFQRLQLIEEHRQIVSVPYGGTQTERAAPGTTISQPNTKRDYLFIQLTPVGIGFVEACRPPQAKR